MRNVYLTAATLISLFWLWSVPASAVIVAFDDFEDDGPRMNDTIDDEVEPSLLGGLQNDGRPGNWLNNKYDVDRMGFTGSNGEWFDDFDTNPDTNWQPRVVENRVNADFEGSPGKPGWEMFLQNVYGTQQVGQAATHEGKCSDILSEPGPCNGEKYARDAFLQFSTWDAANQVHVPRPAMSGETLKGSFRFTYFWGNPAFALTNDVQAMVDSTDDPDLHMPLTKWTVGFGQTFHPIDEGLEAWYGGAEGAAPQHQNAVSLLAVNNAHNGRNFDVWIPTDPANLPLGQGVIALDPGPEWAYQYSEGWTDPEVPWEPGVFANGAAPPWVEFAFEYVVGASEYASLTIDYLDGDGPHAVTQGSSGGPVPIGQPALAAADGVDGFLFSDTSRLQTQYFIDDICFEIIPSDGTATGCDVGPAPLLGDANNDNQVTGADLIAVQQSFGSVDANSPTDGLFLGDANDDGLVTGADLITVQQNFGNVAASPIAVPEPTAMLISCIGFLGLCRRRRLGT